MMIGRRRRTQSGFHGRRTIATIQYAFFGFVFYRQASKDVERLSWKASDAEVVAASLRLRKLAVNIQMVIASAQVGGRALPIALQRSTLCVSA
jgi:hypothetical protein